MSPDDYCQEKAAASGSSFYYSFLFLPQDQRRAITALYAFCREVDDVVDGCQETAVARRKLDWWQEEIRRCFAGAPTHPVTRALREPVQHYDMPAEYFFEVIDGMRMDLERTRYNSFSELSLYCHRVAGVVGLLSAAIFGYRKRATARYAETLGTALQLTNILRDIREDAQRGRIYIPLDELARHDVDPDALLRLEPGPSFTQLCRQQAGRARDYYRQAIEWLPEEDRPAQRSGLVMARIYLALLDEIEADGFRVLEHRIALTPLRKLWIAWRTTRHEKRRARRQQHLAHEG
ncbi:MAG TPA: squalene synthase HpnD [Gammaproteobacteria bacterium]|nr:squalene synthase HpnD [Gammaproteobacteria bacterium]